MKMTEKITNQLSDRLQKQLAFIMEIDKVKNVFRQSTLSGNGRRENVAEHCWHMAMMAYLLREYANEKVDIGKVMLMLLNHDVIEIYAGDTYAFDEEGLKTQEAREDRAKVQIFSMLPDDQKEELMALFDEFNEGVTAEAKFAKVMDNLQPLLLDDSNGGAGFREHKATLALVNARHAKSREGSDVLFQLTEEIVREHVENGNILS